MTLFETMGLTPLADRHLDKSRLLFRQGDPVHQIYVIRQGKMRMIRHLIDGAGVTLHVAGAGRVFAEASLFSDHYHCDGMADEDSRLTVYRKNDVLDGLRKNPAAAVAFMSQLAHSVQALRSKVELINIKSATERVLTYIQMALPPGQTEMVLDQSWKSVAGEIGLTHEALYRALATLQKTNHIVRHGRRVVRRLP